IMFALTPTTTGNNVATLGIVATSFDPISNANFDVNFKNGRIIITPTAFDVNNTSAEIIVKDAEGRSALIEVQVLPTGLVEVKGITKFGSAADTKITHASLMALKNVSLTTTSDTIVAIHDNSSLTIKGTKPGAFTIRLNGTNGVMEVIGTVEADGSINENALTYKHQFIQQVDVSPSADTLTVTFSEAIDYETDIQVKVAGTIVATKDSITINHNTLKIEIPNGNILNANPEIVIEGIRFKGKEIDLKFRILDK
ncbi:MAG: hypothetical protein ABS882_12525, partial [Lysinibacillus sp.]